jgi:hypothetical protein
MTQANGLIEKISFGGIRTNEWGETASCFVTINGESYSCNVKPYNGNLRLQTKVGDNYVSVTEGMHVVFNFTKNESNGKVYNNFKSSELMILTGSTPQPAQSTSAQQAAQQSTPQEKVPQNLADEVEEALVKKFCDGLAALVAAYKFKGKEKPKQELIDRMSNYVKKMF